MIVRVLFILFCIFPFTQVISLSTYNQPYALVSGALVICLYPQAFSYLGKTDRFFLSWLAVLGTLLYALALLKGFVMREMTFYLSYISPLIVTTAFLTVLKENYTIAIKILTLGCIIWVTVSLIQTFIDVSFLTFLVTDNQELSLNVEASGRGVLGLAPEPTHNGFHLFILGTVLYGLSGNKIVAIVTLLSSVVLAGSSSVVFAAAIGSILWAIHHPIKNAWFFGIIALFIAFGFASVLYFGDESRLGRLATQFLNEGFASVLGDGSVNTRLAGAYLPLKESVSSLFWPHGMSLEAWLELRWELLRNNLWAYDLSYSGPASGFGMIILQGGFLGLIPVIYFFKKIVTDQSARLDGALFASCFIIYLSQLYIAAPSFGLVLGTAIYLFQRKATDAAGVDGYLARMS